MLAQGQGKVQKELFRFFAALRKWLQDLQAFPERLGPPKRDRLGVDQAVQPQKFRIMSELMDNPGCALGQMQDELLVFFGSTLKQWLKLPVSQRVKAQHPHA